VQPRVLIIDDDERLAARVQSYLGASWRAFQRVCWFALTVALTAGCEDPDPGSEDASVADAGDDAEVSACSGAADTERENGEVTRARLSTDWEYRTEAATGSCLNPCDTCVGLVHGGGSGNHCSVVCDVDDDCESDQTCFGCWDVKACVKLCDSQDDCNFDETCEAGLCLWVT
jgi:hypothetical protein